MSGMPRAIFLPRCAGSTSLYLATGQLHRRADVLVALLLAMERRLARPFAEAREAWTASSLTLGQRIELTTGPRAQDRASDGAG